MAIQIPRDLGFNEIGWRRLIDAVFQLVEGRHNAFGEVTLRANQTTTVVNSENCGDNSVVLLSPRTANAAAAIPTTYVSSVARGSFTLTHANNAQADKRFDYTVDGG